MREMIHIIIILILIFSVGIPVVSGAGNTLNVGQGKTYTSIQTAINAADINGGDTIIVDPGLYKEKITIDRAITLKGATAGISKKGYVTPTDSDYTYDTTIESVIAPTGLQGETVVTIATGDVVFDGFIVKNTAAIGYSGYPATYLIAMTAGGNLNNVIIRNNVLGPLTNLTAQDGRAGRAIITISKWSPGTGNNNVYNLQIRDNKIFNAKGDGSGIMMIGAKNTSTASLQNQFKGAVIDNNEITGNHRAGIEFSAGVQGGSAAADHIKITNNLITSTGWNSSVDKDNIKWGNGIVLMRMTDQLNDKLPWASRYIDIEGNEFSNNEKNGIYIGPITRDVTIKNNIIQNNGAGTSGYSIWDGIRIDLDETYQIEELARHPEQGTYSGQKIYDYLTNVVINENKISGNGGYGLQVIKRPLTGTIDAGRNWWGASSGPLNSITNPSGAGNAVGDNIEFAPWYKNTAKTDTQSPASGSGASLIVSPANFTTLQSAINQASSGNTIKTFPGTYDERIVINKSLTLLGATSGVSKKDYAVPSGYVYDATKESIISPSLDKNEAVVQIILGSVTFDGFIIGNLHSNQHPEMTYPLTDLITLNNQSNDYTDVRIQNNVVGPNTNVLSQDGTKGRGGIVVVGPSSATVHTLTIANNKIFDAKGDGCGIMLLGSVNSTAQTMTSTQGSTGKYKGSSIENNNITGNHRSGIEVAGGVQGGSAISDHFRIANNSITNNGWNNTVDKNNLKYGNGIILIHVGSDKENKDSWGSRYVDIDNNQISNNEKNGIYVGPVNRDINITNNIIRNNGLGTGGYSTWDGMQVDLNESYHNPLYKNYAFLSGIFLKDNEISASGNYGVRVINTPTQGSIDARNNWWGDASGPKATKNPSGTANSVSENVVFSPWYTSPLKTETSTTLPKPMATFTVSPVEAMTGETFSFDASESAGLSIATIQSYQWNYGDGNTSVASGSPLKSYIYNSSKVYNITLSVKDSNGMTNQTTRQVSVIARKDVIPLTFTGTTVSGATGTQEIKVDSSTSTGTVTNTTTDLTIKNPGSGWDEMVVVGNTTGGGGTVTVQNITEVILKAKPSVTTLDTTTSEGNAGPGAVTTSIQLSLKQFASAPLEVDVTQGANTTVADAFQLAAGSAKSVDAVAYTMTIKGSSLINSNLSSSSEPVTLNMSVSEAWVQSHGGISAIKAIRYADDGTKEVLETQYLFSAGSPTMYFFKVISPHGCSIFGIASVSDVSSSSPSTGSGSSDSDSGGRSSQSGQQKDVQAQPQPVVNEPPPAAISVESLAALIPHLILNAPPQSPDVPAEGQSVVVKSVGIPGMITAFIRGNIVPIGMVAAAIVISTGLVVWYRRRDRWNQLLK
jgi:hypothetical protein